MDKPTKPVDDTERLDSWKEIASYLKRGVRTVQRWEASGLPVHRLELEKRGAVHAYKSEIDLWWQQRSATLTLAGPDPPGVNRTGSMRRRIVAIACAVSLVLAALFFAKGKQSDPQLSNARRLTWEGGVLTPALSADEKWIAFSSPRLSPDQNLDLWLRPAGGGDLKRLTQTPEQEFDPVFAPDSSRILYSVSNRRPGAMGELEGAPPPSVTSLYETTLAGPGKLLVAHASSGRYSADGRWIALLRGVAGGGVEFGIMPARGGEFIPIPVRTSSDDVLQSSSAAVWSPDSRFILLSARTLRNPRYQWWLLNIESHTAALTHAVDEMMAAGLDAPPILVGLSPQAWLPNGTVLAKEFDSGGIRIVGVHLEPGSVHIRGKVVKLASPVSDVRWFSLAGRRILFDGGEWLGGLDVVPFDLDNGRQQGQAYSFRRNNPGAYTYLSIAANGRDLAFISRQLSGGGPMPFIVDIETGRETRIAGPSDNPANRGYTSISSDGKRVAYSIVPFDRRPVYLWDSTGGRSDLVSGDCGCRPLSWTPDGRGLLVTRPNVRPQSIAFFDIGTGGISDILVNPASGLNRAEVSPSGSHILFSSSNGKAFVAPFGGSHSIPQGNWKPLGSDGQRIAAVFWSPNGKRLFFVVAEREGMRVLSQTFDASRSEPTGDPTEVYWTRWQPVFGSAGAEIVAAGNRIVFATGSVGSDLWIADLAGRP
jgi:Tol biopolymer transport system component